LIELGLTENDPFKHVSKHCENSNRNKVLHCTLCGLGQTLFCEVCKVILCQTSKDNVQFALICFTIWHSKVNLVDKHNRLLASRHAEKEKE
jgi:hypothetical protein